MKIQLYYWGDNSHGQLGNGATTSSNVAVPVANTLITDSGGVNFFSDHQLISGIYAGYQHTCMTDNQGELFCWGDNSACEISSNCTANGHPDGIDQYNAPMRVNFNESHIAKVALGYHSTCLLTSSSNANDERAVYCYGDNQYGQLGMSDTNDVYSGPTQIASPTDFTYDTDLSCSASISRVDGSSEGSHCCAIEVSPGFGAGNSAFCWGSNINNKLGVVNTAALVTTPSSVLSSRQPDVDDVSLMSLATSDDNSCAIAYTDTIFSPHKKKRTYA